MNKKKRPFFEGPLFFANTDRAGRRNAGTVLLFGFHHDLFGLNLSPSVENNAEHPVFVRSLNALLVDRSRDAECPAKCPVRSFNLDVILFG